MATLIALGPGDPALIPLASWRALEAAGPVALPDDEPLREWLGGHGIAVSADAPVAAASGERLRRLLALRACQAGLHRVYNLGSGTGFSVREVIDACRDVTAVDIPVRTAPRRGGDPAILVASSQRIQADLGWRATAGLRAMVADAWQFARTSAAR